MDFIADVYSMTSLHPLTLGSRVLSSNIWYAPLAGCSDWPHRMMTSTWKPGLVFCEMAKMDALVRADEGTYEILHYSDCMHPIGAQLFGNSPIYARQAARIIEDMGFDVIDLNCGCPVPKVTRVGGGSFLLKTPLLIGEILSAMVGAVRIPVTVKVRAGWDEAHINVEEVVTIAESAGASAITVHARTRAQGYSGIAQLDWIKRAKDAAKHMLVIGNGDIVTPEKAFAMMKETGCDGVSIGRATMDTPWIAEDIRRVAAGHEVLSFSVADRKALLQRHFDFIAAYKSEKKALVDLRRVGGWYFTHFAGAKAFRSAVAEARSVDDVRRLIAEFDAEDARIIS